MKTKIVSAEKIAESEGLRLDAHHYVGSVDRIDKQILSVQRSIERAGKRLESLKKKRAEMLAKLDASEQLEEMSDEELEERVHEMKSDEAAIINNGGRVAQIAYLKSNINESV